MNLRIISAAVPADSGIRKTYRFIRKYGFLIIYALWFSLEIVLSCSTLEFPNGMKDILFTKTERILKYALIGYIVFFQRYSRRELLAVIPVSILLYHSARLSASFALFYTWLLIVGSKSTYFRRIVKLSFILLLACILCFPILCRLGILPESGVYRDADFRPALGFVHPNSFGVRLFILCACWFYLRERQLCAWDYVFGIAAVIFAWAVPNSRTCAFSILSLLILFWIESFLHEGTGLFKRIGIWISVAIVSVVNFGSVLLSVIYKPDNQIMRILDNALSGRISLAHRVYNDFGISLLGQRVYITKAERMLAGLEDSAIHFDNSYMRILLYWGVIIYILVSAGILVGIIVAAKKKKTALFICLFSVLIYSVSEKILYQGTYNVFILALGWLFRSEISCEDKTGLQENSL